MSGEVRIGFQLTAHLQFAEVTFSFLQNKTKHSLHQNPTVLHALPVRKFIILLIVKDENQSPRNSSLHVMVKNHPDYHKESFITKLFHHVFNISGGGIHILSLAPTSFTHHPLSKIRKKGHEFSRHIEN